MENSVRGLMFSYVGSLAGQEFGREQSCIPSQVCMPGDSDPTPPYQISWYDPLSYKSEASLPTVSSRPARERPCLGVERWRKKYLVKQM